MLQLQALHQIDARLFVSIFTRGERPTIRACARILSRSAEGYLHVTLPFLLTALAVPGVHQLVTLMLMSLAVERVVYWVLKNSLKRPRPQDSLPGFRSLIPPGDKFSFPSGHTSAAFVLATALCLVYEGPVNSIYFWAGGIAFSRVLLGVHYPGDTLAGALMGSSIVVVMANLGGM